MRVGVCLAHTERYCVEVFLSQRQIADRLCVLGKARKPLSEALEESTPPQHVSPFCELRKSRLDLRVPETVRNKPHNDESLAMALHVGWRY